MPQLSPNQPEPSVRSSSEEPKEHSASLADNADSDRTTADRRVALIAGGIFLAILICQYLYLALDQPEPLPWERSEAFEAFRVEINTASWIEWSQLEGIGPALAHRIVADRRINGPFASIDDVARVQGIGEGKLRTIRPWLTIQRNSSTEPNAHHRRESDLK